MRIAVPLILLVAIVTTGVVVLVWIWQPVLPDPLPVETAAPAAEAPPQPPSIDSLFEDLAAPTLDGDALRAELEAAIAAERERGSELRLAPTITAERPSIESAPPAPAARIAMPTADSLATFPWPPPAPSAQAQIPPQAFRSAARPAPSLAEVGAHLTGALDQSGHAYSFYRAPNGFALVSRLERIGEDGTRIGEAGLAAPVAGEPFRFNATMAALAAAPAGFYRIIVFVVSDGALVPSTRPLDEDEAGALAGGGAPALPDDFNDRPFTDAHFVTALIYEFRKGEAERDVATLYPGRFNGVDHLRSAGLMRVMDDGGG